MSRKEFMRERTAAVLDPHLNWFEWASSHMATDELWIQYAWGWILNSEFMIAAQEVLDESSV